MSTRIGSFGKLFDEGGQEEAVAFLEANWPSKIALRGAYRHDLSALSAEHRRQLDEALQYACHANHADFVRHVLGRGFQPGPQHFYKAVWSKSAAVLALLLPHLRPGALADGLMYLAFASADTALIAALRKAGAEDRLALFGVLDAVASLPPDTSLDEACSRMQSLRMLIADRTLVSVCKDNPAPVLPHPSLYRWQRRLCTVFRDTLLQAGEHSVARKAVLALLSTLPAQAVLALLPALLRTDYRRTATQQDSVLLHKAIANQALAHDGCSTRQVARALLHCRVSPDIVIDTLRSAPDPGAAWGVIADAWQQRAEQLKHRSIKDTTPPVFCAALGNLPMSANHRSLITQTLLFPRPPGGIDHQALAALLKHDPAGVSAVALRHLHGEPCANSGANTSARKPDFNSLTNALRTLDTRGLPQVPDTLITLTCITATTFQHIGMQSPIVANIGRRPPRNSSWKLVENLLKLPLSQQQATWLVPLAIAAPQLMPSLLCHKPDLTSAPLREAFFTEAEATMSVAGLQALLDAAPASQEERARIVINAFESAGVHGNTTYLTDLFAAGFSALPLQALLPRDLEKAGDWQAHELAAIGALFAAGACPDTVAAHFCRDTQTIATLIKHHPDPCRIIPLIQPEARLTAMDLMAGSNS